MILILDSEINCPDHCDGCWALDDDSDHPRCKITNDTRGYTFPIREKRMPTCPMSGGVDENGRLLPTGNCQRCIYTFGTLGCCDTVNNVWHWSCDDGMTQYYRQEQANLQLKLQDELSRLHKDA